MLPKIDPVQTTAWKKLQAHSQEIKGDHLRNWFINDPLRFEEFSLIFDDILFDFSKNRVCKDTIDLLEELFNECKIYEGISMMFEGEKINETEGRAVLHTALRNLSEYPVKVDGVDVMPDVKKVLRQMKIFSGEIISGNKRGYSGKTITDIVNIGIGGSDLGPHMVYEALKHKRIPHIQCHFVSNIDEAHIAETLGKLDPETTLFIIASKTFTTQETMTNAHTARSWFLRKAGEKDISDHFVAVSTNADQVKAFGIDTKNMFTFWDWVGGRYSVSSAIGLSLCCSLGFETFEELLEGAHSMDQHFRNTPFRENIPLLLAAIGIWNTNFLGSESEAILPYSQNMHRFAAYFQQGNMESNGKSVNRNGVRVNYHTGPVIWGEPGTNGQHAFYQLIHQGTRSISCDFIGFVNSQYSSADHQDKLLANFFAQSEAMMKGKTKEEVMAESEKTGLSAEEIQRSAPFRAFEGNIPSTSILAPKLAPRTLGVLISCYEHKIFAQGFIWNIFSFDQWGVELGKQLAQKILTDMKDREKTGNHDSSTNGLINFYKKWKS